MRVALALLMILFSTSCGSRSTVNPAKSIEKKTQTTAIKKPTVIARQDIPTSNGFGWPVKGEVLNSFGANTDNVQNKGLNIRTSESSAKASASGKVVFSNYLNGWGQMLILEHPSQVYTIYANLANISVREGQIVRKGEAIGEIASSGRNGERVLHFELRKRYLPQNPLAYFK